MEQREREQAVLETLKDLRGLEPLKKLFWSELNYDHINQPLPRHGWNQAAAGALAEDAMLFAGGGQSNDFHVIYGRLAHDRLLLGHERLIVTQLLKGHEYALFIFSNLTQDHWHFINVKYDADTKRRRLFRRITVGPEERLRTAAERLALIDLEAISGDLFGLSPLAVQQRHDEAFDVETVTDQFFKEYRSVFSFLEDYLTEQTHARQWAHDYSLQFLNRCMFLYFIQRKGWLGNDRDFLMSFWQSYRRSGQPDDTFVERWLKVLFFEAFNDGFHGGHIQFPDEIRDALSLAPYLNGGLFTPNKLDQEHGPIISDRCFEKTLKFLEQYNFTISEDSPLDKEVAVDPEMIGKVYESLINISDDVDARGEAGIFYTPRTEIDLMCRLALVDHLSNHLGQQDKSLLNQLAFSLEPDEKPEADEAVARAGLWRVLKERLHDITVLDPACGSGSFLVGMLNVLDDLQERADRQLGGAETSYDRKKRIIGQSLYGVDVMEWACHVAELRLWLALIIDADFTREELHVRREPLLPHFSFKIRCGDSLVQEVGGINLGHTCDSRLIPHNQFRRQIGQLREEKLKFYNNDDTGRLKSIEAIRNEEKRLFLEMLNARQQAIQEEIKSRRRKMEGRQERRIGLDGTVEDAPPHQMDLTASRYRKEIETLTTELAHAEAARRAMGSAREMPFVWDIAFVEIFEGENEGFDIVIGNPPYVRQEMIAAPVVNGIQVTGNKKEYKAKLMLSVCRAFPNFFGYKSRTGTAGHNMDTKSDLYIYFYLHGLSLLNDKGSFCFITSNSWLDVDYGAELQEFLLKHCHVKLVLDNQAKRTFANADVNSIIALFSQPDDRHEWALDKTARFVMFRVPFEHILSPVIFDEIEGTGERRVTEEYRVFPIQQRKLLEDGCELPQDDEDGQAAGPLIQTARYIGNKWGGKYLRAPDIYWTILEKGKGKLVRLRDIAEVRRGFTTGANEFFYMDEDTVAEWGVEPRFLERVVRSPRECRRIVVNPEEIGLRLLMCHEDRPQLRNTVILEYIKWGESQGFNERPTCRARARWWDLGERDKAPINVSYLVDRVVRFFFSEQGFYVSDNFQEVHPRYSDGFRLAVSANSSILQLSANIAGRANFGGGLMKIQTYEIADLLVPDPDLLGEEDCRQAMATAERLDLEDTDRRTLDSIVFDALDLTHGERDAVYEAVMTLVEARLKKAGSV